MRLHVNVTREVRRIKNVIGVIRGAIEPGGTFNFKSNIKFKFEFQIILKINFFYIKN